VVVVCGTLVRRAHRRFSPGLSGPLVDYGHLDSYKQKFDDTLSDIYKLPFI
jgi:hypothetical protein